MAAVSTVTVSVGTGSVAAGTAFVLLSSSSIAEAAFSGPRDESGLLLESSSNSQYTIYEYSEQVDLVDALNGRNWVSLPLEYNEEGEPVANVQLNIKAADMMPDKEDITRILPLGIKSTALTNLKINLTGDLSTENITLSDDTEIHSRTLWVTGVSNSLIVGRTALTRDIKDLYVNKVALVFDATYDWVNELAANIHIGASDYIHQEGEHPMNGSALIIGMPGSSNVVSVTTSGTLDVMEAARISFGNASYFTVDTISGSGVLTIVSNPEVPTGATSPQAGYFTINSARNFTGRLKFEGHGTEVIFGSDMTIGGLEGTARDGVRFSTPRGVAITLTLNVPTGVKSYLKSTSTAGAGLWDSHLYVQKSGGGEQSLLDFSGGGVGVSAGRLYLGGNISIGERGVNVTGGTLTLIGSETGVINFAPGTVRIKDGRMEMVASVNNPDIIEFSSAPVANMRDVVLDIQDKGVFSTAGTVTLGEVTLRGGELSLLGTTDMDYASMPTSDQEAEPRLSLKSGKLTLGGNIVNLRSPIVLGKGMSVTVNRGLMVDLASINAGTTQAVFDNKIGRYTFSYVVEVLHAERGASVNGWYQNGVDTVKFTDRVGTGTQYSALAPIVNADGSTTYGAGVSWDNTVVVQELDSTRITWRNNRNVEGVQTWMDGQTSLALRARSQEAADAHTVIFTIGQEKDDLTTPLADGAEYRRRAVNIFIDNNTEMVLRQATHEYVSGGDSNTQYLGDLKWQNMLLMGTLTLKDKNVIGKRDSEYGNRVDSGPNALVVIDWRSNPSTGDGIADHNYNNYAGSRFIGDSDSLPYGYTGRLELRSGVFIVRDSDNFSDITVKSGGQLSLNKFGENRAPEDRVFNGNITLSGRGVINVNDIGNELALSSLKLIDGVQLTGTITIADAATIHGWVGEEAFIEGSLIGAGLGQLTFVRGTNEESEASTQFTYLDVNNTIQGIKLFNVQDHAQISINTDFDASNIDLETVESRRFNHMTGAGRLVFTAGFTGFDRVTAAEDSSIIFAGETDAATGVEPSLGAEISHFTKDGVGEVYVYRHFDVVDSITVSSGRLYFGARNTDAYRLSARDIVVSGDSSLIIAHRAERFNVGITLNNGSLVNAVGWDYENEKAERDQVAWRTEQGAPAFRFRSLAVSGADSSISWSGRGNEGFAFETLTGSGELRVGIMNNPQLNTQVLVFDEIRNYSGTVYVSINEDYNKADTKRVIIGTVHQDVNRNGSISISGGYVFSSNFRKTGEGSFEISNLRVSDEVWMNYEGTFSITNEQELKFTDGTVLHYTAKDNNHVIFSRGVESDSRVNRLFVDVLSLSDDQLRSGINLGFYSNVNNSRQLFEDLLLIGGFDKGDYDFYMQNGRLYLRTNKAMDQTWDRAMGVKSLAYAPSWKMMEANGTSLLPLATSSGWGEDRPFVELGRSLEGNKYWAAKNGQMVTYVNIAGGDGSKYTLLGGRCYDGEPAGALDVQSYIYMSGEKAKYHLLVGGSGNSSADVEEGTGFFGGTHIQMMTGAVDYIVAGNHLSSGAFAFRGDTYVSIQGGKVNGGIVGGSTYAGGGGAFEGSSHIFIYTPLAGPANVPSISLPTLVDEMDPSFSMNAAPFTMVVGGSAYVSDAPVRSAITFTGDSEIVVDLSAYSGSGVFGKDIVGGNAYLAQKEWADTTDIDRWDSSFIGDSSITITGKKATFRGAVVGATHHDINGNQHILFQGDTAVNIHSGIFREAIAGGAYHGSSSTGNYSSVIVGDTQVTVTGGTLWRVTGGSYVLSSGVEAASALSAEEEEEVPLYLSAQEGNTSVLISGGSFDHTAQKQEAASGAEAESYRSFVAGGRYISGQRADHALRSDTGALDSAGTHYLTGSSTLTITGGSFAGSVLAGGDFVSATLPQDGERPVNTESVIAFGSYTDISGATVTDGVVLGGSYLTDSVKGKGEKGSITVQHGSHLTIGKGATITGSASGSLSGIAAIGGSYLDVSARDHYAYTEDGSSVTMNNGTVNGHIVGGSVLKGFSNVLSTSKWVNAVNTDTGAVELLEVKGSTAVSLYGGKVNGNVYGGHYVGSGGDDPRSSAITSVGDINVTVSGSAVTGNVYGGGSFLCGMGTGSTDFMQSQGAVTVSLLKGSLTGNVYAAGAIGRPAENTSADGAAMQPEGARVSTQSTRVELASAFSFGAASTTISGDYHLTDKDFDLYNNEPIAGGRTLAFVDSGNYAKIKNWSGVAFRDFDAIEVAAGAAVSLSEKQFIGADSGFTKLGEGQLTLGGALSSKGYVAVFGGTLTLEKKQNLSGGLRFDLSGHVANDPDSVYLDGRDGYANGSVPLDFYMNGLRLDSASMETVPFGRYYLASNWDEANLKLREDWLQDKNSSRKFELVVENGYLILHVKENSTNPWLWRGDTKHPIVKAFEWDSQYSANWNAHEMFPDNASLTPEGKDVLFTASVGGEVIVGELVHPSSVTVASGSYVFRQRAQGKPEGTEGIWTDRLIVGGDVQEAVLDLCLANRNVNNVFIENNGTLILNDPDAISSSLKRPEYNTMIYFNGGKLVYGESFDKDVSWQISPDGVGRIQVDVDAYHTAPENPIVVEDDDDVVVEQPGPIVWGKLYDSEEVNTWIKNMGLRQVFTYGLDKGGEGTLRFAWGSNRRHHEGGSYVLRRTETESALAESVMKGDLNVNAGKMEFLMNGTTGGTASFRHTGAISVEEGAEVVYSVQNDGIAFLERSMSGDGTVIIGRQLGEACTFADSGVLRCTLGDHSGYMPMNNGAPYVLGANNGSFFGTIVLEGESSREAKDYVLLGQRYTTDRFDVQGIEKDKTGLWNTSTLTCLGGGKTTVVLAGRHLSVNGILNARSHADVRIELVIDGITTTFYADYCYVSPRHQLTSVDWHLFGDKYVRTGVIDVQKDTVTYIGSSSFDSQTDNSVLAASLYRHWDNRFVFTGKLTGEGVIATPWGGKLGNGCGGYGWSRTMSGLYNVHEENSDRWEYWARVYDPYTGEYVYSELLDVYVDDGYSGLGGSYSHRWLGPISEFTGVIVAGDLQSKRVEDEYSNSSWTFSASSATDEAGARSVIQATLAGGGTMIFAYTQDTVLEGPVGHALYGDNTRIINDGPGKIILGSKNNLSTALLWMRGASIDLGDDEHEAYWKGTAIRGDSSTTFTLVNGRLEGAMKPMDGSELHISVVTSPVKGTTVDAGGTSAKDLFELIINKDGYLTGLWDDVHADRDHTYVRLVFSKDNVGSTPEGQHMIELRYNRHLYVNDTDYFVLDFSVDSIVDLLKEEASSPQSERYLHILSKGTLEIPEEWWDDLLADGGDGARLLSQLGLYVERVEQGELVLHAVGGHRAYRVFGEGSQSDSHYVKNYNVLSGYEAVVLEGGQTLYINLMGVPDLGTRDDEAGGALVPNLWGDRGSAVTVTNDDPNRGVVTVVLDNADPYDGTLNSIFLGTISGGEFVDFVKTGAGTMTIGYYDKWDTSGGFHGDNLEIRKGGMVLQGKANEVRQTLTFNYSADAENNGLTLLHGATTVGRIVEKTPHEVRITMGANATLALTADEESSWNEILLQRENDQSTGYLILEQGTVNLTNAKKTQLQGVHLNLKGDSQLSVNRLEEASAASLSGSGTLVANVEGTLKVTNEDNALFTGTLVSATPAAAPDAEEPPAAPVSVNTLHMTEGVGVMTMRNVKNDQLWNLHNDGKLVLDVSGQEAPAGEDNNMSFGHLHLGSKSATTYYINPTDADKNDGVLREMFTSTGLTIDAEAKLVIEGMGGFMIFSGTELTIAKVFDPEAEQPAEPVVQAEGELGEEGEESEPQKPAATTPEINLDATGLYTELYGFSFLLSDLDKSEGHKNGIGIDKQGNMKLYLKPREREDNIFAHKNQETNAAAGARLFWDALWEPTRLYSLSGDEGQDLRNMLVGLDRLAKQGEVEALDRALAGGAGASISVLGPALAQDMQRQLRAIRNRTTSMSAAQSYTGSSAYHAWINAEGNYHKMQADSLAPGFTVSNWGGTVGMDADVTAHTTVGLAITAMYGNLDTEAADKGDGKMDNYYLSFFGKTARGRWMHTAVGSIGLASMKLDRTVDYGGDSPSLTSGSTNGYAFGLMYELGYSIPMNSEASYALQPFANVTLRHVGISGYEERGNGAQLRADDITETVFTIGAGMRAQAVVGENAYNRASVLEGRVVAKLDLGDSKGKATNSLVYGSTTSSAEVESAELGPVALELGLGITVPLDNSKTSLFLDASAELRSGYTNMNATVGLRIDF